MAWTSPRVDFCYRCLPGGPLAPPPCAACGADRYFSTGLCIACHPFGPDHIESCQGCLAWGVSRTYRSRCWTCRWWRHHYVEGDCHRCRRRTIICEQRVCRLCWVDGQARRRDGRVVALSDLPSFGQQLFFANVQSCRAAPLRRVETRQSHPPVGARRTPLPRLSEVAHVQRFSPVPWTQLPLFELELDPAAVTARAAATDTELVRYCDEVVRDHARKFGWSAKQTNDVRRSLRLVQALQHTANAKITATDVLRLPGLQANVSAQSTLDVLAAADLLVDDRRSPVERYFRVQFDGLPADMTAQLRIWFDVMIDGSRTAPRRRPRAPATVRLNIGAMAPILRVWASQGHDSLAEIERDDVVAALPDPGPRRKLADQGLRSLFGVLKSRKVVFADPMRFLPLADTDGNIPLPLDTDAIRAALASSHPGAALAVALVAFHALTGRQLRGLQVTDVADGRLTLGTRVIVLAPPVLPRLAAWLDYRTAMWPNTINSHLFVNRRTAPRLTPVSRPFPWRTVNLRPQTLREDRILDEVRATGGDVRRICELFGLSVEGALRYTSTYQHSDNASAGRSDHGSSSSGGPFQA